MSISILLAPCADRGGECDASARACIALRKIAPTYSWIDVSTHTTIVLE